MAVDEGFDITLDNAKRCAEFVRDVGHEILAHDLQPLLFGDIVEHEEHPGAVLVIERRDERAGDFNPDGAIALDKLDLALGFRPSGAHSLDVSEKGHAMQDELEALVGGCSWRRGKWPEVPGWRGECGSRRPP